MSRPKQAFADRLDQHLSSASPQEIRDMLAWMAGRVSAMKLGFRVRVEDFKEKSLPLLDQTNGDKS